MAVEHDTRREGLARWLAGDAPAGAAVVAYLALAPFMLLPALYAIFDAGDQALETEAAHWAIRGYAVLHIGVIAGIRVGTTLRFAGGAAAIALIPPIAALASFFAPFHPAIAVIAMLLAAQGAADAWASHAGRLPGWYGQLRARTTPVAVILVVAIFLLLPAEIA